MRITLCFLAMTAVFGQNARSSVRTTDSRPTENDAADYWSHYVQTVDSFPSAAPSAKPSPEPSAKPSAKPSREPSAKPSREPSAKPSREPSAKPSREPSAEPSAAPSKEPSVAPSKEPSAAPSSKPSAAPSVAPSSKPSAAPSHAPSSKPSAAPSHAPSSKPSAAPSHAPSSKPSAAPSSTPSAQPTIKATARPTPQPTPAPVVVPTSPSPTGECGVDVVVEPECPALPCNFDRCVERPFRMQFRVDTRTCDQSVLRRCPGVDPDTCACVRDTTLPQSAWPAQQYVCNDFNGGPPAAGTQGTFWVQATPQADTSVIYFQGAVSAPGGTFNAVAPAGETELAANTFLNLYACATPACTGPGPLLQQVSFDSSCTQQLYLSDILGSFQLIQFESTDQGVVGNGISPTVGFTLSLNPTVNNGPLILDYLSIVVLSVTGVAAPQIFNFPVAGRVIPPPYTNDATVNLIVGEPFNVITTVGGSLNGLGCFDITNSTIECDATVEPPPNPCPPTAAPKKGSKKGKGASKGNSSPTVAPDPNCPPATPAPTKNSKKTAAPAPKDSKKGTSTPKATDPPKSNKGDSKDKAKNRRTERRLAL